MSEKLDRLQLKLLVLRCQIGDNVAFEELVTRFSPGLRYFLSKMLSRTAVDDAMQDVWLSVWRGLARLLDADAFATWTYRIARDRAYQELRTDSRIVHMPLSQVPMEIVEQEITFSTDDVQRINEELGLLPAAQREALTLHFIEGMKYEEVAAVVGCPVGTVRSRIYYGKQSLKQSIAKAHTNE